MIFFTPLYKLVVSPTCLGGLPFGLSLSFHPQTKRLQRLLMMLGPVLPAPYAGFPDAVEPVYVGS